MVMITASDRHTNWLTAIGTQVLYTMQWITNGPMRFCDAAGGWETQETQHALLSALEPTIHSLPEEPAFNEENRGPFSWIVLHLMPDHSSFFSVPHGRFVEVKHPRLNCTMWENQPNIILQHINERPMFANMELYGSTVDSFSCFKLPKECNLYSS